LLLQILLSGLVPDVITCKAAESAYEKGAQWQQVRQLFGFLPNVKCHDL
jgi:hypothetical protein